MNTNSNKLIDDVNIVHAESLNDLNLMVDEIISEAEDQIWFPFGDVFEMDGQFCLKLVSFKD